MDKNILSDGRNFPMNDQDLKAMLEAGPAGIESSIEKQIPAPPQGIQSQSIPQDTMPEMKENSPNKTEGPDDEMRKMLILPSEKEQALLKEKYGILRVVPLPYTRADGKYQTYILRQLNRSQWRVMEDASRKIAESKPGVPVDEIFQEKIVSQAIVWPNLPEHEIASSPAGLVPTLFGIVQQVGLFFNPEAVMSVTFNL